MKPMAPEAEDCDRVCQLATRCALFVTYNAARSGPEIPSASQRDPWR